MQLAGGHHVDNATVPFVSTETTHTFRVGNRIEVTPPVQEAITNEAEEILDNNAGVGTASSLPEPRVN